MYQAEDGRLAPERFVDWLSSHAHVDARTGLTYRYHPRSDAHSVALCRFVAEDLIRQTPTLRDALERRLITWGINVPFAVREGRLKTLDLAFGKGPRPLTASVELGQPRVAGSLSGVVMSCEAKSVMTEHAKSQPRVYDELSSSHEIIHQADPEALAAGIAVVNMASEFISPTRQVPGQPVHITKHKQPHAAANMVSHLRGLPFRTQSKGVGFDALAIIVIECDNIGEAKLWTDWPAPQPGERDHYASFLSRLSASLEKLLAESGRQSRRWPAE